MFLARETPGGRGVPAHRAWHRQAAWYARWSARSAGPPNRIAADRQRGGARKPLDVMLVVREGPARWLPRCQLAGWPVLRLVGVDSARRRTVRRRLARECCAALDLLLGRRGRGGGATARPGAGGALDVVASRGYRAKYRTGGVELRRSPRSRARRFRHGCTHGPGVFKCRRTATMPSATPPRHGFTPRFLNIWLLRGLPGRGDPRGWRSCSLPIGSDELPPRSAN